MNAERTVVYLLAPSIREQYILHLIGAAPTNGAAAKKRWEKEHDRLKSVNLFYIILPPGMSGHGDLSPDCIVECVEFLKKN